MNFQQWNICSEALRSASLLDETAVQELYGLAFRKNRSDKGGVHGANGRKRGRKPKYANEVAEQWDWTLSNSELSRKLLIGIGSIEAIRRRLGKPFVAAPHNKNLVLEERRKTWDWSKNDPDLAFEHGIVRERVRQIRMQLGMPPMAEVRKVRHTAEEDIFLKWANGAAKIDFLKAKRETKLNPQTIIRICKKLGIERMKMQKTGPLCKHPWDKFNWNLPNKLLAAAWHVPNASTVATRRSSGGFNVSRIYPRNPLPAPLQIMFDQEKEKAAAWRKEQGIEA